MIPVFTPKKKPWCFRACIASILEIDISEVPRYSTRIKSQRHVNWWNHWLRKFKTRMVFQDEKPGGYSIGIVEWRNNPRRENKRHAVVCKDGYIFHDPSYVDLEGSFITKYISFVSMLSTY